MGQEGHFRLRCGLDFGLPQVLRMALVTSACGDWRRQGKLAIDCPPALAEPNPRNSCSVKLQVLHYRSSHTRITESLATPGAALFASFLTAGSRWIACELGEPRLSNQTSQFL